MKASMHLIIDNDFLQEYIDHRFSPETVNNYNLILRRFESFMSDKAVEFPERSHAREFLLKLSETNSAISTNQYLLVLRIYSRWLIKFKNDNVKNVFEEIQYRKEPDPLPVFLIGLERELLYKLVDEDPAIKVQEVVMLDTFIGTGIRSTELCNLKTNDFFIHHDHGFFRLRVTKGNKQREVIMPDYTKEQIQKFIHLISLNGYKEDWIFPNSSGAQLTRQGVYNRIEKMIRKIKTRKKGAHMLRHTFATWAMDRNVPLKAIQIQLGHTDPNSTQIYTHTSKERLLEAHKAHPRH